MIRDVALGLLGLVITVVTGVVGLTVLSHVWLPHPILPVVLFLGVNSDISVVRGAILSFLFGYLLDVHSGNPMGLQTFVAMATFATARYAGFRFFMRGVFSKLLLTLVVSALAGFTILALRAIFETPPPFDAGGVQNTVLHVLPSAVSTTAVAIPVFALCEWVRGLFSNRQASSEVHV